MTRCRVRRQKYVANSLHLIGWGMPLFTPSPRLPSPASRLISPFSSYLPSPTPLPSSPLSHMSFTARKSGGWPPGRGEIVHQEEGWRLTASRRVEDVPTEGLEGGWASFTVFKQVLTAEYLWRGKKCGWRVQKKVTRDLKSWLRMKKQRLFLAAVPYRPVALLL